MRVALTEVSMGLKWTDSREIGEACTMRIPILIRKRFDSPICIMDLRSGRFRRRPAGIERENPEAILLVWLDEAE